MIAIIPAAGHGTRFLPVTRAVPKEMLPIGSKPALELIIEEARSAGATKIILIISHGKELIREYFKDEPDVTFVYQTEQKGLGHAVLQAWDAVEEVTGKGEKGKSAEVLILLGDALVLGCNASKEMVELSRTNGGASVIGCERVPPEKVSRYGIMKLDGGRVVDMVEKPSVEEAPSDLAVAGRYLLDEAIFDYLKTQTPGKGGEIQLTDAIRRMITTTSTSTSTSPTTSTSTSTSSLDLHLLLPYVYPGHRQDIGNPDGYYAALTAFRSTGIRG